MARNVHNPQDVRDLPLFAARADFMAKPQRPSPTRAEAVAARDRGVAAAAGGAGAAFLRQAAEFIRCRLRDAGPSTAEELVDAAKASGIVPLNDRAFGPVMLKLARAGEIEKTGQFVPRRKGNMSGAQPTWRIRS